MTAAARALPFVALCASCAAGAPVVMESETTIPAAPSADTRGVPADTPPSPRRCERADTAFPDGTRHVSVTVFDPKGRLERYSSKYVWPDGSPSFEEHRYRWTPRGSLVSIDVFEEERLAHPTFVFTFELGSHGEIQAIDKTYPPAPPERYQDWRWAGSFREAAPIPRRDQPWDTPPTGSFHPHELAVRNVESTMAPFVFEGTLVITTPGGEPTEIDYDSEGRRLAERNQFGVSTITHGPDGVLEIAHERGLATRFTYEGGRGTVWESLSTPPDVGRFEYDEHGALRRQVWHQDGRGDIVGTHSQCEAAAPPRPPRR